MSLSEQLRNSEKNFSYPLAKDKNDNKEVRFVMPADKLPASLKDYRKMNGDQQGAAFVDIMKGDPNNPDKKVIQEYGSFQIDGKPATDSEYDRNVIYRALRRTGIELAKRDAIQVDGHSSFAISAADHDIILVGNKAETGFDEAYLRKLWPMIENMTAQKEEPKDNHLIAMAAHAGKLSR